MERVRYVALILSCFVTFIYLFIVCVCMYVRLHIYIGKWSHICPIEQMGVREQFGGASSLLLPFGFWD